MKVRELINELEAAAKEHGDEIQVEVDRTLRSTSVYGARVRRTSVVRGLPSVNVVVIE